MRTASELPEVRAYERWTESGLDCYRSQANCQLCYYSLMTGKSKYGIDNDKCHQPESNEILIGQGINPPRTLEEVEKIKRGSGSNPGENRAENGRKIRQEILRLIGAGHKTKEQVAIQMDRAYFLNCQWNIKRIDKQMIWLNYHGYVKNSAGKKDYVPKDSVLSLTGKEYIPARSGEGWRKHS